MRTKLLVPLILLSYHFGIAQNETCETREENGLLDFNVILVSKCNIDNKNNASPKKSFVVKNTNTSSKKIITKLNLL